MLNNFKTYQLALELYKECEKIRAKPYIHDQMMRAALSVVLNLAEGSAKPTPKDRRRFYMIALASLREVQTLLSITKSESALKLSDVVGAHAYKLAYAKPAKASNTGPTPGTVASS